MARKVAKPVEASAPASGVDDLSILHPDGTLTIAGRTVNVREYRFVAGLRIRIKALPLTNDLRVQVESGSALNEEMIDVLASHEALLRELMLDAIEGADVDPARTELAAWMEGLNNVDGEQLLLTWWGVCGPFLLQQVMRKIIQQMQLKADLLTRVGAIHTPVSPPPDTATLAT